MDFDEFFIPHSFSLLFDIPPNSRVNICGPFVSHPCAAAHRQKIVAVIYAFVSHVTYYLKEFSTGFQNSLRISH
jgi:hypothetical protein